MSPPSSPIRAAVLRWAVYLSLAVVLTWPLALHPGALVPGAARTDLWNSLWSLWFFQDAVWSGALPWHTDLLGHPEGGVLVVADPVNALLGLPLVPLLGVAATYSVLVLAHLVFSGLAAHALAREVHGSEAAGWIAGVAYLAAPTLVSGIHNGTSEAVGGGWAALAVLLLLRALRAERAWRILPAGLALGVAALASPYYGLGAWLFWAGLLVFGRPDLPWKRTASRAGLVAVVALLVTLPGVWMLHEGATAPDNLVGIKDAAELEIVRRTVGPADPRTFFVPGGFRSPDFGELSRYGEQFVHCTYLGWVALIASGVALVRERRGQWPFVVAGVLGAVAAMGPVVCVDGGALILDRRLVIGLPWFLIEQLPGFSSLSLLYRLALAPALALAVLAAGVVRRPGWERFAPLVAALVFLELRLASPVIGLPELSDAALAEPIEWLAQAPEGAVMNYPVVGGRAYLYEQTRHEKPVTGGLNFPNGPPSRLVWSVMIRAAEQGQEGDAFLSRVQKVARQQGIRYVVVHDDPFARPDMHDAAVRALDEADPEPAAESEGMKVHKLW